ncbi:ciliary rootlet coiled-coil protein 2 [Drosophila biarmipes]|uniref:ciliary rootlet coiled-coil protein 2 n=1 Tax=Drosophila biarmipes TaxID=125945 RepID=UPI0007E86503|nr:ciliary rootlet coiled-coil protein 2 [Drosophila biarmipes]
MGNAESTQSADDTQMQVQQATDDEPWWNSIEHENLVLEQAPPSTVAPTNRAEGEELPKNRKEHRETPVVVEMEGKSSDSPEKEQTLEEFREELRQKREARQNAVQDMRDEIANLKKQLANEQAENRRLRNEEGAEQPTQIQDANSDTPSRPDSDPDDENPSSRSRHANIELASAQLALQQAQAENLSLRGEVEVVHRQVGTLKEVISCCKQMLSVKEEQCAQLKMKLTQIENSFSEREMKIMSNNLRQEYERQLVNIRQLRQLYEERQRVAAAEYENLQRLISIKRDELTAEQEKTKSFEERNQILLKEVETANEELAKLREECSEHKFEKRLLSEQVGAVNMLFSQLIMGFNGKSNMDIDRVNRMLEENRQLLNQMTQAEGNCSDGATLPKLLFELVEQATGHGDSAGESDKSRSATPTPASEDTTDCCQPGAGGGAGVIKKYRKRSSGAAAGVDVDATAASLKSHEPEIMGKVASAQEIIGNLPKVWKVLMELLSHHKIERVQFEELPSCSGSATSSTASSAASSAARAPGKDEDESHRKPPELSVSKTYIKLKDLILEKKSLVKETNRLKTLNSHLDYRLNQQEKRLSGVSLELTKTWHLVGKMQRQHRQLHTQEQILRYQLQQKRRLLSELKDELEYCRRKWALARAKNDESQEQCDEWRREFARRKLEDANHSAESGYSDSGPQSDEERDVLRADLATVVVEAPTSSAVCRRKLLRDQFEHTRKIKRMQSTSPGRQGFAGEEDESEDIVLRWNSAPPTCGWREDASYSAGAEGGDEEAEAEEDGAHGGGPQASHSSRSRQRSQTGLSGTSGTASRIQKLEEQCKNLIQQVLETSGNRERLEIQLCQFQDDISPAQHAVPLEEFINRKRMERMTRASSAPATGSLTPREEEYTRKRSERLGRLEEESRQLMSRIKRTADRGQYLKKSLDRIRRAPSREASFESNTEEEAAPSASKTESAPAASPLTAEEEEYTSRRAARNRRLEEESRHLISQLSRNAERGDNLATKLDTLHEQHGPNPQPEQAESSASISQTVEQRLEDIERVSANRAERLRLLETQGNELIARLSSTSERGTAMINRIAEREATRRQEAELVEQTVPTEETTTSVNSIASTRIVGEPEEEAEGAACCVTVTTTSSQLALKLQSTGAIPKTTTMKDGPQSQLCAAARQDDAAKKRSSGKETGVKEAPETLEDMVQRLRALPFPGKTQENNTVESENSLKTHNLQDEKKIDFETSFKQEEKDQEGEVEDQKSEEYPAAQLGERKHKDEEH